MMKLAHRCAWMEKGAHTHGADSLTSLSRYAESSTLSDAKKSKLTVDAGLGGRERSCYYPAGGHGHGRRANTCRIPHGCAAPAGRRAYSC
jgi:hypothetical protein